jgi:hypothetical protein
MTGDVVILGAGFSRAVSSAMPMTAELGQEVLKLLSARGANGLERLEFDGSQLERWLSRLAEPQPDLSAAKNSANQSLFLMATEAVRDVIVARQLVAHADEMPWWLRRLLGVFHFQKTTVATFNYDTLVETAIGMAGLFDQESQLVTEAEIIRHMPPLRERPAEGMLWGTHRSDTFRYLKLHGSVDTFWIPGDVSGASIGRWHMPGTWGEPQVPDDEDRRQVLPGTEAYIVPPAAAKSSFYANPLARELWRTTAQALAEADRVTVVGYSLPLTDLVTSGMLADTIVNSTCEVVVVDPGPELVGGRLVDLGVDPGRIRHVGGDDCVMRYAQQLDEDMTVELPADLDDDVRLVVGWGTTPWAAVTSAVASDGDGLARVRVADATGPPWASATVPVRELLGPAGRPDRIEVEYATGRRSRVAHVARWSEDGSGRYLVLTPSAREQQ